MELEQTTSSKKRKRTGPVSALNAKEEIANILATLPLVPDSSQATEKYITISQSNLSTWKILMQSVALRYYIVDGSMLAKASQVNESTYHTQF